MLEFSCFINLPSILHIVYRRHIAHSKKKIYVYISIEEQHCAYIFPVRPFGDVYLD